SGRRMAQTLDSLERENRRKLRASLPQHAPPRPAYLALAAFVTAPFAVTAGLFVPFFGQLLVVAAVLISIAYLAALRSIVHAAAAGLGAIALFAFFGAVLTVLRERGAFLWYSFFALSIVVTLAYIVAAGGALWHFWDR